MENVKKIEKDTSMDFIEAHSTFIGCYKIILIGVIR